MIDGSIDFFVDLLPLYCFCIVVVLSLYCRCVAPAYFSVFSYRFLGLETALFRSVVFLLGLLFRYFGCAFLVGFCALVAF